MYVSIGREDFLTEAVIFWKKQKIEALPNTLVQRLSKVCFTNNEIYISILNLMLLYSGVTLMPTLVFACTGIIAMYIIITRRMQNCWIWRNSLTN